MAALRQAFEDHDAFAHETDATFSVSTATFDARVMVGGSRCELVCELPTIDAAVVGETVADAIAEGWFETLQRRLEGVEGAVNADDVDELTATRSGDTVIVETTLASATPADDALAVVNFVEGTWFQGVIPGYDYVETVQAKRERAMARGGSE